MLSDSQVVLGWAVKELCGTDNQTHIILALTTITLCNVTCKKTKHFCENLMLVQLKKKKN